MRVGDDDSEFRFLVFRRRRLEFAWKTTAPAPGWVDETTRDSKGEEEAEGLGLGERGSSSDVLNGEGGIVLDVRRRVFGGGREEGRDAGGLLDDWFSDVDDGLKVSERRKQEESACEDEKCERRISPSALPSPPTSVRFV